MQTDSPLVVVIAGPNGAGKSTAAPHLLRDAFAVRELVNADTIAHGLSALHPESVSLAAGRVMLQRLRVLEASRDSFAFETTLASRSFAPWLSELRDQGFRTHLAFLSLPDADVAVARVAERVLQGGHDVPEDVIRRRFVSGLANFFALYMPLADTWKMFDNSAVAGPRLIAEGKLSAEPAILDQESWQRLKEVAR
jgi:predicted ABC-type ATPase